MSKMVKILIALLFGALCGRMVLLDYQVGNLEWRVMQQETRMMVDEAALVSIYEYVVLPSSTMIDRVMPSVVRIVINTSLFHPFTGEEAIFYGTGMVISEDGKILTCNHLFRGISNKAVVRVITSNGEMYRVMKLVGDDFNDLAMVKIEPNEPMTPVVLNEQKNVKPGDEVWAIGNPFNLGLSISNGVVSRTYNYIRDAGSIQIDASLNPGNSGCPVFDRLGRVVGVTVSLQLGAKGGISFVIGMDKVNEVLPELLKRMNE